jgi:hypothetical protein
MQHYKNTLPLLMPAPLSCVVTLFLFPLHTDVRLCAEPGPPAQRPYALAGAADQAA